DVEASADADVSADATGENDTTENASAESESNLSVSFDGDVTAGENVRLVATQNGTPVEHATVTVNGEVVGTTNADGEVDVDIPETEDGTVVVAHGDAETELELEFISDGL
ncbi:hypothetical protein D3D02_19330, partial [Halobellus sp. Atlit-38R]